MNFGTSNDGSTSIVPAKQFTIIDGTIAFPSEAVASQFLNQFKNKDFDDVQFEQTILAVINSTDFLPLQPFMDLDRMSEEQILRYETVMASRTSFVKSIASSGQEKNTTDLGLDDFDSFVKDELFATVLNINGDIIVGDKSYHYTPAGLFITSSDEGLRNFKDIVSSPSIVSGLIQNRDLYSEPLSVSNGVDYFVPEAQEYKEFRKDSDVTGFNKDIDESGFGFCGGMANNTLWGSVFGPSSDCTQEFSNRKRLKTKVWNQNYLLYSSLGTSVRSQRKRLGIWWASDADELELGIDFVTYLYPAISPPVPSVPRISLAAQTPLGQWVDINGRVIDNGPFGSSVTSIARNWPINIDEDWIDIKVYIGFLDRDDDIDLFNGAEFLDIKDRIDGLIRSTVPSMLRQWGGVEDRGIEILRQTNEGIAQQFTNESKNAFRRSRTQYIFDYSTGTISYNGSAADFDTNDLIPNLTALGYDQMMALVWGGGRRDGRTRGNRVGFAQDQ